MEQIKTETVIDSLIHLESYYQSRYEHYLAMATVAKENRERVGLLLQDLERAENYRVESNSPLWQQNNREAPPLLSTSTNDSVVDLPVDEGSSTINNTEQMKRFLQDLSMAMSVIESISNSDLGKTLHISYLHKTLNRGLDQELSVELVELYLEEAVKRGYLEPDYLDSSCYIARSIKDSGADSESIALVKQNGDVVIKTDENQVASSSRKPYNLPPSSKLKPTLLETIEQYIVKCSPKRFSIQDVVNYLYPQKQQLDWSQAKKNKVGSCISNILSRKTYLGKYWTRTKPGVYSPLAAFPLEQQ